MKNSLQLTNQELNIILFALQKQPYEVVNDLIQNIVAQIKAANEVKTDNKVE
jgi:hypothetical protein